MFCPRCSAQNSDDTKFCRACGTNLATVSLALADPQQLNQVAWEKLGNISMAKRRAGVSNLIHGTGWIMASTIVGVVLGLFSNLNDWIYVWLGLASWMAVWGVIQFSQGVNKLVEARTLRHEAGLAFGETTHAVTQNPGKTEPVTLPEAATTNELSPRASVVDHTTELLKR